MNEIECLTLLYIITNKIPKEEYKNSCIIIPYLGQKELIEEYLIDYKIKMEVSSIDAFQGKEKDFVIINTVRSNTSGEIGFLKEVKRLNVSISRAKYGLIIIGNTDCLYNAKIDDKYSIWRKYIEYLKNNNALVTYNMTKNTFEKYVVKDINKDKKDNENEDENQNVINEEIINYEKKYDYDGSKNNYNTNIDLINKHCGDRVSDQFYYNPIKQNEDIQKNNDYQKYNRKNNYNYNYNYYNMNENEYQRYNRNNNNYYNNSNYYDDYYRRNRNYIYSANYGSRRRNNYY